MARTRSDEGLSPAELARLRAVLAHIDESAQLSDRSAANVGSRGRRVGTSVRRRVTVLATVMVAAAMLVGVAVAAPTTSTTNVTFVPLSVGHKVLSATIAANKTSSPVVIGASTTVPADATTVQVSVTAKGAAGGTVNFYPAGNVSGGSGQSLTYPGGNVVVSATIQENVGQSGELTFANSGTGSVVVTATLLGYSTQVTAGDINGVGGTAGQVLTNTGAGAASWQTQGQVYASHTTAYQTIGGVQTTIDAVTVPAGVYVVTDNFVGRATVAGDQAFCHLVAPNGAAGPEYEAMIDEVVGAAYYGNGFVQTVFSVSVGGPISLRCNGTSSSTAVGFNSMIATQEGGGHGVIVNG